MCMSVDVCGCVIFCVYIVHACESVCGWMLSCVCMCMSVDVCCVYVGVCRCVGRC